MWRFLPISVVQIMISIQSRVKTKGSKLKITYMQSEVGNFRACVIGVVD